VTKTVVLLLVALGSAAWGLDRLLTRMARKLGSQGQGPPWVRRTRAWLDQWPVMLELILGTLVPILTLAGELGTWKSAATWREWGWQIALAFAAGAGIVLAFAAVRRPPYRLARVACATVLVAGSAASIASGVLGSADQVGTAGALMLLSSFVLFRRAMALLREPRPPSTATGPAFVTIRPQGGDQVNRPPA